MKATIVCLAITLLAGSALAQNATRPTTDSLTVKPVAPQEKTVDSSVIREKIERAGYTEIAELTRGAYCRFNPGAARQLAQLLRAVAAFAVGGGAALEHKGGAARLLLGQLRSVVE